MQARSVEREALRRPRAGVEADLSTEAPRYRRAALIDVNLEHLAVPVQVARADHKARGLAEDLGRTALGHRPAPRARTIERDVQRAVVQGIGRPTAAGPRVIWREHAPQERDHGESISRIIAQRIEVPPLIAIVRERAIEA